MDIHGLSTYALDISFWLVLAALLGGLTGWFWCGPKGWKRKS
ncbi:MAG: hypothetical protein ACR2OJ_03415 [Hyphomicrobiales bacterium]